MDKPIRNILCYSHYDFDNIMRTNNWKTKLPEGVSAISICSPNEGDLAEHWFKSDYNVIGEDHNPRVFNLDIDDASPFWFENQIAILEYTQEYKGRIVTLFTNGNEVEISIPKVLD